MDLIACLEDLAAADRINVRNDNQTVTEIARALASDSESVGAALRPSCPSVREISEHRGAVRHLM